MSYLHLAKGLPDFTKAVISLWFRVPQKSMDAAKFDTNPDTKPKFFNGIIPLVVMGKKGTQFTPSENRDSEPTYIGVFCQKGAEDKKAKANLVVFFETGKTGTVEGTELTFYNTVLFSGGEQHQISADEWHHVLISVELKNMASHGWKFDETISQEPVGTEHIEGASRLYLALDDVNYTKAEMSGYYPEGNTDHHAVVSSECLEIANTIQAYERPADPHEPDFPTGPIPHFSATGLTIPSGGQPMGLPATKEFVDSIHIVEMAEFQMFTGKTLDTGVRINRRAFIDRDGKPVPPDQKKKEDADGEIIKDSGSIELLNKRPEILLHGSSNWVEGYNTGSIGVEIDTDGGEETKLPDGQFKPVAGIEPYKPDPSLEDETA